MQALDVLRVSLKALVIHFSLSHVILLGFHALFKQYITKTLARNAPSYDLNLIWLVPSDTIFTFAAVAICLQVKPQQQSPLLFYSGITTAVSLLTNIIGELRVLVYFHFPVRISALMCITRTVAHAVGNSAMVFAIQDDI